MRWWLRPTTTSTTSPRGESASNSIPVFANAIRSLGGGDKSPTWNLFFKVTPYELAAPVLGNELEAMRRWVQLLAKGGEPALAAYKKPLEKLIAEADAAMKARTDAALANEHFRTKGGLAEFFTDMSKQRDGVAASIDAVAAKSKTLPRNYASRFFRKRTAKVSAEEKAAKAAKKEAERLAKVEAAAAVKAAQAKVKAAMAELKAAKNTK